jgi:hypothetical protein
MAEQHLLIILLIWRRLHEPKLRYIHRKRQVCPELHYIHKIGLRVLCVGVCIHKIGLRVPKLRYIHRKRQVCPELHNIHKIGLRVL